MKHRSKISDREGRGPQTEPARATSRCLPDAVRPPRGPSAHPPSGHGDEGVAARASGGCGQPGAWTAAGASMGHPLSSLAVTAPHPTPGLYAEKHTRAPRRRRSQVSFSSEAMDSTHGGSQARDMLTNSPQSGRAQTPCPAESVLRHLSLP